MSSGMPSKSFEASALLINEPRSVRSRYSTGEGGTRLACWLEVPGVVSLAVGMVTPAEGVGNGLGSVLLGSQADG